MVLKRKVLLYYIKQYINFYKIGFETTFRHELRTPSPIVGDELPNIKIDEEMLAELDEYTGITGFVDEITDHFDIPYWMRQKLESTIRRRTYPGTPFVRLSEIKNLRNVDDVEHINIDPNEALAVAHNQYVADEP
jgi:hypothetical protein